MTTKERFPRDNLFRGVRPLEFRAADDANAGDGRMVGHFAVINQWTTIRSCFEGEFVERFAAGAFKKTIKDARDSMRVLFQHGRDPQIGDKPLGPIEELSEDDYGAAYVVELLDTSYNRDLIPGLKAGQYGASFRFSAMREDWVHEPKASEYNPNALPERTIREAEVMEFGPVTFPAYGGATAGLRSLTDDMLVRIFADDPERTKQLLGVTPSPESFVGQLAGGNIASDAPPADAAQPGTSEGRRESGFRPLVVTRNPNRKKD